MYTGLHPKQRGHQIVGGSIPLLHAGETLPGVLHTVLESPAEELHGPVEADSEKGQNGDQKDGTPPMRKGLES